MKQLSTFTILILIAISFIDCDTGTGTDPVDDTDFTGIWTKINTPSFSVLIGVLDGQPDERMLFCDQSINGIGCAIGIITDEEKIILDDPSFPELKIEPFNNTIRISPIDGVSQTFTGTFEKTEWNDGNCGLYKKPNNRVGPLENNCVVGEWYSFLRDPFTNESQIIYKSYFLNGEGEMIIPHENKEISFEWFTTNDNKGDILHEFNFSDQSDDKEFAYICTEDGLALGLGGSWIRNNIQCLF